MKKVFIVKLDDIWEDSTLAAVLDSGKVRAALIEGLELKVGHKFDGLRCSLEVMEL